MLKARHKQLLKLLKKSDKLDRLCLNINKKYERSDEDGIYFFIM